MAKTTHPNPLPTKTPVPRRLQKAIDANEIVRSLGDYDSAIVGVLGEVYAEEIFGMKKAPRGTKGIDGYIRNQSVSVKSKESDKTGRYVTVDLKHIADLLVIVVLCQNGFICHYGPIPVSLITSLVRKNGRLYLNDLNGKGFGPTNSGIRW
jgi:hypothetical protein